MRKSVKIIIVTLLFLLASIPSTGMASFMAEVESESGQLKATYPNPETGYAWIEGTDIIGELPIITVYDIRGNQIDGTFTYPNYDNTRLGIWDLIWVFTPSDASYETISGSITLNIKTYEEYTGETREPIEEPTAPSLTATSVQLESRTAYDINLYDKISGSKYKWSSSNTDVAKVNAKNGLVTAISEGTAIITCEITLPDKTVQILSSEVTVGYDDNAPLLTETVLDLSVGDKFDINLENKVAKSKYRWVSSNRDIVTVNSANGKVTAKAPGEAYVTCTITTPDNQVIVLRCDINVTAPAEVTE